MGNVIFIAFPFFIIDLSGYNFMVITLLFVELIKWVYDKLRIYKDIPQGKLVVNFETSPRGVRKKLVRLF